MGFGLEGLLGKTGLLAYLFESSGKLGHSGGEILNLLGSGGELRGVLT